MSYLNVIDLDKKYGENTIFENIRFHADQGKFVTLLGPSGCGKSTLLRCIAGLTEIDSGQIVLNGQEITHAAPQKRNIAMVFQSYALFPNMTVYDNVAFGLKMRKVRSEEIRQRVGQILELVELEKYRDRYPQQLSGGQCQRVALARSLVTRPDLLLLDEPLSALDARIRKHLRQQIRQIQQELNLTTIFVTHDQEEALTMSDRIVLMNQGRIEQNSDAETLYLAPQTHFSAGFIGSYNILSAADAARLLGCEVRSDIAIRPESISLEADREHGRGVIVERSLLGNIIRYKVRLDGVDLTVDKLNLSHEHFFPLGTPVSVSFEQGQIRELQ
ncbi:ABC transporter ATP-binding protein [Pasteurella testudinis]|uniref:ABC transporter ATP-binding protein n=1 Tax=Pasteurella testudinis TaxID=761 RepID=UPI004059C8B8